jgi:hypothetical protein
MTTGLISKVKQFIYALKKEKLGNNDVIAIVISCGGQDGVFICGETNTLATTLAAMMIDDRRIYDAVKSAVEQADELKLKVKN